MCHQQSSSRTTIGSVRRQPLREIQTGKSPRNSGRFMVWSRRITAGSQFPWELSQPRGALVAVVGGSELAWQQSMAPRRLHAEDATGRAVRHPVRKSQAGAPEDAQGRTVRLWVSEP